MKIRLLVTVIFVVALALSAWFLTWFVQRESVVETKIEPNEKITEKANLVANYGAIPLHFESNAGQADSQVKFLSRGSGYSLFLTSGEAVLALQQPTGKGQESKADFLRMKIAGANTSPVIAGENLLEGKTNYIVGNDASKWKTDIANYESVRYSNIYDGVDVVYYGNGQQLEYDLVVGPNVSPDKIELNFIGAEDLTIADNGDLVFMFGENELRQHKPLAYQEINGQRKEVAANYEIQNPESKIQNRNVGFAIGEYDHSRPLIIDPVLSYATYLGGSTDTFNPTIAVDSSGNAYITGVTTSIDFPTVNPFQASANHNQPGALDVGFVTKLNAAGTAFVYSTYLGSPNTIPTGIKVDAAGSAFVAGYTGSNQFPTTSNAFIRTGPGGAAGAAGFITKLSPSGASLLYSTYLASPTTFRFGGQLTGIAIDSSGNAYVTGVTGETSFPTTAGAFKTTLTDGFQNAFVTKLNAMGSALVYSTFVGASVLGTTDPIDRANAIAVDSSGNAYITGQTISQNFPVTSGAFQTSPASRLDAFVTKLNANGTALVYSTYLGGSSGEIGNGIAVDGAGNAYVTGLLNSGGDSDFPFTPNAFLTTSNGGFGDIGFLTKINGTGTALIYSTALSIRNTIDGSGVAVDSTGSAYVIGGESQGAAYSINAVQSVSRTNDAFVMKMNPAGTGLVYSTPLGGSNGGGYGAGIAIDAAGNAYITGATTASDFPVTSGAPQPAKPGGQSQTAFVAKISSQPNDCPAITINPQPLRTAIAGQSYTQQLTATGGVGPYTFSLAAGFGANNLPRGLTFAPDGTLSGTTNDVGTSIVTVQVVDRNGCIGIRTYRLEVRALTTGNSDFYLKVVARPIIRIGNEYNFFIEYGNNAATDAVNVPLLLRVPDYVSLRLRDDQPSQTISLDGYTYIVVTLPRIRAMSSTGDLQTLPIIVKVTDPNRSGQIFSLEAYFPKSTSISSQTNVPQSSVKGDSQIIGDVDDRFVMRPSSRWDSNWEFGPPCGAVPPGPLPPGFTSGGCSPSDFAPINPQTPSDPNEKTGSVGVGTERYYRGDVVLPYVVTFENVPTASLPAQDVVVTDQLDPNVFDLSTFRFNLIAFGDKQVMPLIGVRQFTTDVDLRPAKQAIVRVNGNFNTNTGLITWRFNTLDPNTGQPPQDPQAGFLPPNRTSPEGQGTLLFTVKAKTGLSTGTQVKNKARIVFDVNAAIDTPEWLNTIDNSKPVSSVSALPANVPTSFLVTWSGSDVGAGIGTYTIFVSDNGAPFTPFFINTASPNGVFTGQTGHTYSFYSIARDLAGNMEPSKTSAEATTMVVPAVTVSGRVTTPDGRGLRNATVSITDPVGSVRTATTSSFGFYSFDNVATGQQYTLRVSSRLYRFAQRNVQVTDTLTNVDFVGLE